MSVHNFLILEQNNKQLFLRRCCTSFSFSISGMVGLNGSLKRVTICFCFSVIFNFCQRELPCLEEIERRCLILAETRWPVCQVVPLLLNDCFIANIFHHHKDNETLVKTRWDMMGSENLEYLSGISRLASTKFSVFPKESLILSVSQMVSRTVKTIE
jgi:hypothetical protein